MYKIGIGLLIVGLGVLCAGLLIYFEGHGRDFLTGPMMYREDVAGLFFIIGLIAVGIGSWFFSKSESEKLLTLLNGMKEEADLNLGSPNKSSNIQLNQVWRGGESVEVNQKGLFNFYDDSFSVKSDKLKGKIICYKYDDVISQTDKAGIITLPQQIMFFYTNDDNGYVIEFDSVADKIVFVEKCKHLGSKNDDKIKVDSSSTSSTADELKKFKELLDSDAITQEEFDAKKKELLGL